MLVSVQKRPARAGARWRNHVLDLATPTLFYLVGLACAGYFIAGVASTWRDFAADRAAIVAQLGRYP